MGSGSEIDFMRGYENPGKTRKIHTVFTSLLPFPPLWFSSYQVTVIFHPNWLHKVYMLFEYSYNLVENIMATFTIKSYNFFSGIKSKCS